MKKATVGVIGCGQISSQYLDNLVHRFQFCLEVVALADINREAAERQADEYGIATVCGVDELLADPGIELVVNLTIPTAHFEVSMAALAAGKHVYTEKPLAVTREESQTLIETARSKRLMLGGAPDTFLGAGLQTCRKLIDEGWVGRPFSVQGMMALGRHVERYHKIGIGPLFDMGQYYVTAMIGLLGPVGRVTGSANIPFETKFNPDTAAPEFGRPFTVDVPTNVSGILDFESGAIGVLTTTNEAIRYKPRLDVYGSEGILSCNDPNTFGGPVSIERHGGEKTMVALTHYYDHRNRGLGLADMVYAIRNNRPVRAGGDLMLHVHEVLHAIQDASQAGQHIILQSRVDRPEPFPAGHRPNIFES